MIFTIVAVSQYFDLAMPIIQVTAQAKYRHMIALNMLVKSTV